MLTLLLLACAPAGPPPIPTLAYRAHVYQMAFNGKAACAPSALLSALRFLEPGTWEQVDPQEFDAFVRRHAELSLDQGVPAQAPFQAFTYAGVTGRPVGREVEELKEEALHGTPVTVITRPGTRAHVIAILGYDEASERFLVSDPAERLPHYWTAEQLSTELDTEGELRNHAVELVPRAQAIANCKENPKWCRFAPPGFLNEAWVMR